MIEYQCQHGTMESYNTSVIFTATCTYIESGNLKTIWSQLSAWFMHKMQLEPWFTAIMTYVLQSQLFVFTPLRGANSCVLFLKQWIIILSAVWGSPALHGRFGTYASYAACFVLFVSYISVLGIVTSLADPGASHAVRIPLKFDGAHRAPIVALK